MRETILGAIEKLRMLGKELTMLKKLMTSSRDKLIFRTFTGSTVISQSFFDTYRLERVLQVFLLFSRCRRSSRRKPKEPSSVGPKWLNSLLSLSNSSLHCSKIVEIYSENVTEIYRNDDFQ